jgi:hypothetical protein
MERAPLFTCVDVSTNLPGLGQAKEASDGGRSDERDGNIAGDGEQAGKIPVFNEDSMNFRQYQGQSQ